MEVNVGHTVFTLLILSEIQWSQLKLGWLDRNLWSNPTVWVFDPSGQITTTSDDRFPPKGGDLVREISYSSGKSRLVNYCSIWPDPSKTSINSIYPKNLVLLLMVQKSQTTTLLDVFETLLQKWSQLLNPDVCPRLGGGFKHVQYVPLPVAMIDLTLYCFRLEIIT